MGSGLACACLESSMAWSRWPVARSSSSLLVDCWEGAALRSRLRRDARPLGAMLDFYFDSALRR